MRTWRKVKAGGALRGWRAFADGKLYHPVVTEKVIEGCNGTLLNRWAKECDRIRKENKAREKKKDKPLDFPPRPTATAYVWPPASAWISGGNPPDVPLENRKIPPENALNRMEGKGMDVQERAPAGLSHEEQPSRLAATREGLWGPARDEVREVVKRSANVVSMPA